MAERNVAVPPEERIEFRIGVNVGDIIIEGTDIFGDGVNVAARLQALAEPGGICVSGRVQEDVQGKMDIALSIGANTSSRTSRGLCGCIACELTGGPAHRSSADALACWPPWLSRSRLRWASLWLSVAPSGNLSVLCLLRISSRECRTRRETRDRRASIPKPEHRS